MALIVQKFGGSSVKDAEHLRNVADIVTGTYKNGNDVVVVVSAQGDTTDDLIDKGKRDQPKRRLSREMDYAFDGCGEQISACAACYDDLEDLGYPVVSSLLGWQCGLFHTLRPLRQRAHSKRVNPERIKAELSKRKRIVVGNGLSGTSTSMTT